MAAGLMRRAGEVGAGLIDVAADLLLERRQVGITRLIAQLVHELDFDAPAVDRLVEVEDEHLEQRCAARLDRRPQTQARRAEPGRAPEAMHAHGEDAADGWLPLQYDVRRGKTKRAPELRPMRHPSGDAIWTPEKRGSAFQVAILERGAHSG